MDRVTDCPEHRARIGRGGRVEGGCWRGRCAICAEPIHRAAAGRPPVTCSNRCRQLRHRQADQLFPVATP